MFRQKTVKLITPRNSLERPLEFYVAPNRTLKVTMETKPYKHNLKIAIGKKNLWRFEV